MLSRLLQVGALAFCTLLAVHSRVALAQQGTGESGRKVVNKVEPMYPDFARRMELKGTVRLEAVVAPTGKVKNVSVKGGHPVLVEAAVRAVSNWKWEAASTETHEAIEVHFGSQ
jgi:TonB family protein